MSERIIDGAQAQQMFDRLHSWQRVAEEIHASGGPLFKRSSLMTAACLWRRAQGQPPRQHNHTGTGLGAIWRPPLPRRLRVVPCYSTDTVRPA